MAFSTPFCNSLFKYLGLQLRFRLCSDFRETLSSSSHLRAFIVCSNRPFDSSEHQGEQLGWLLPSRKGGKGKKKVFCSETPATAQKVRLKFGRGGTGSATQQLRLWRIAHCGSLSRVFSELLGERPLCNGVRPSIEFLCDEQPNLQGTSAEVPLFKPICFSVQKRCRW